MTRHSRFESAPDRRSRNVGIAMDFWDGLTFHILTINDVFTLRSRRILIGYVRIHFVSDG